MPRIQKDASTDARKCIYEAIASIMLDTDYDKISVQAIASEAGVSRSTFYRYFESVDDAIEALEDRYLDIMQEINRIGILSKLSPESRKLSSTQVQRLEILHENWQVVLALLGSHSNPRFMQKEIALMSSYLATKIEGVDLSEDETDLYVNFIISGHNGLVVRWLTMHPDMKPETVAGLLNDMFFAPLIAREP